MYERDQVNNICTAFLTCKMPCEQFLNFFLYFYEGGGKLEKSPNMFTVFDLFTTPNFVAL